VAGDVKTTTVAGSRRLQLPGQEVDATGEKICSTATRFHFYTGRPAAAGTGRQQNVNTDKDCKLQ